MSQTSRPDNPPGIRTGGIIVRGKLQADNVVDGVQIQGGDAETAHAMLALVQHMQRGGIEVVQELVAKNVVTGLQYLSAHPTIEQFQRELVALREQLAQVAQAGVFKDASTAEIVQQAVQQALEQSKAAQPDAKKLTDHLQTAATIINETAETAESLGKLGELASKLAPVATALYHFVPLIF